LFNVKCSGGFALSFFPALCAISQNPWVAAVLRLPQMQAAVQAKVRKD